MRKAADLLDRITECSELVCHSLPFQLLAPKFKHLDSSFFISPRTGAGYLSSVIRNIIFDWSGTLVDDLPAVLQASNFVLTQAGKKPMSLEQFRAEFSLPFKKFYDRPSPELSM